MGNLIKIALASALIMLSACTSSKTTVSKTVDLTNYEYVSVINNDTYHIPAELMEYEIQLFDAVVGSGLQLVGDNRIFHMPQYQQDKLLLVKYGISQGDNETIVTVNFIDYMTGRPVVSCRGVSGLSLDYKGDLKGAIRQVEKQISNTFPHRK